MKRGLLRHGVVIFPILSGAGRMRRGRGNTILEETNDGVEAVRESEAEPGTEARLRITGIKGNSDNSPFVWYNKYNLKRKLVYLKYGTHSTRTRSGLFTGIMRDLYEL